MKYLRAGRIAVLCTLWLTACALAPRTPYVTPKISMPAQWAHVSAPGAISARDQDAWWLNFNDPTLNRLIEGALERNGDLALAGLKLRQARLEAGLARDESHPTVSAEVDSTRAQSSSGGQTESSSAQLALSYELDLWGKLARAQDQAEWEAQASQQDLQSTALALTGTVAELYWTIAYLNQRIQNSESSLAYGEKTVALMRARHAAGAVSGLDEASAEAALAALQDTHSQWLQQREEAQNALALLYDGPPEQLLAQADSLPNAPLPTIRAGLPADLLSRRPDLRAAELRLRSSLAAVDQVRASYYPAFTLTAALGGSSSALRDVLQHPLATLGADVLLPFVQWNDMQLNIQVSKTEYQEAVVSFRQTLYSALSEVENALSAQQQTQARVRALRQELALAYYTERLDQARYRAGAVSLQTWLDAQQARRDAEDSLAAQHMAQLDNLATLCLALGGNVDLGDH